MLIDNIIINILIFFFIYLIIYAIWYAFYVFTATKKNQIGIEQKFIADDLPSNIITIVYANEGNNSVINLVNMLKKQKYPKENYQVHVLFDNVNDETPDIVSNYGDIKVWKISKGSVMGKDEALSWLLEKLISFRNVNAFVFLDANRVIDENFLFDVNKSLFSNDVIVPATEYIVPKGDSVAAIKNSVLKYYNRIFNTSRAVLKLINPIDIGAVVIKQEVLEVVRSVNFESRESGYIYTFFLANRGYFPIFAPDIVTKIKAEDEVRLTFKEKVNVFKNAVLFCSNRKILEFLTTFFKPTALFVIFLYAAFFAFLYNFEVKNMFFYDVKFIAFGAVITFIIFLLSLLVASDKKINPLFVMVSPAYQILDFIFKNKKKQKPQEKTEEKPKEENKIINGNFEDIKVSDGNNIINCGIEVKNTGDGYLCIFRYKNKNLNSDIHPSARLAIQEIADKLNSAGLKLLACASCAHFGFKPDTDVSEQNGLCSCKERMTDDIQPSTSILSSCEHFKMPSELNNLVEFPKDKDNENK